MGRVACLQKLEIITEDENMLKLTEDLITQNVYILQSLSVYVLKDSMLENIKNHSLHTLKTCKSPRINLNLVSEKMSLKRMTTLKLNYCVTPRTEDWECWLE